MFKANNLTTFMCRLSRSLGASALWKLQGLFSPVMGLLTFTLHYWPYDTLFLQRCKTKFHLR